MKPISRRLLCLNLVLLLVVFLTLPVSGSQSSHAVTLHYNGTTQTIETATTLPALTGLLGWTSSASVSPTDLYQLPGIWYAPESTITPGEDTPSDLYAHKQGSGQYAVFDPTSGTVAGGGNRMIYGTVSPTDLIRIVTPDASALQAPSGFLFDHWKSQSGAVFAPGAELSIPQNTTLYLQAQWAKATVLSNGLTVVKRTADQVLTISGSTTAAWVIAALYESSDQMQAVVMEPVTDGQVTLTIDYDGDTSICKIFTLDSNYRPLSTAVPYLVDTSAYE